MERVAHTSDAASVAARRTVASFSDYRDAEHAVDRLSDDGFPVERAAIVGTGLRFVEQVTGREGYAAAARDGAFTGALVGFFFGFLFGLLGLTEPAVAGFWLALWGIVLGALLGALLGLGTKVALGGRRDFSSVAGMRADRYELVVDEEVADRAESLLAHAADEAAPADGS